MAFVTRCAVRGFSSSGGLQGIQRVLVVGSGQMGSGIAQVAAQSGHDVTIADLSEDLLNKSKAGIEKSLNRVIKKKYAEDQEKGAAFLKDTMARVSITTDAVKATQSADIVIEAIAEDIKLKLKLFAELDAAAPASTLFASNTSSLSVTEIARSTKREDRFGGLHFFNPVPVMKLVEVVRADSTSDEAFNSLMDFCKAIGKSPVSCKDTPGFVVNRLLVPYIAAAVRMLDRGEATAEDIDAAMMKGCGYPMGPLKLADVIGIDTLKMVTDGWHEAYPNDPDFLPTPGLMNQLVAEGKHGVKTGEGFYVYKKK